jgi:hypothetical protein
MNVGKSLVAAAAFTLACSYAQTESPTSLLDDMRSHPEKYGCSRNGEGFSCPAIVSEPSHPADDKSWGDVAAQYFKPLKKVAVGSCAEVSACSPGECLAGARKCGLVHDIAS